MHRLLHLLRLRRLRTSAFWVYSFEDSKFRDLANLRGTWVSRGVCNGWAQKFFATRAKQLKRSGATEWPCSNLKTFFERRALGYCFKS